MPDDSDKVQGATSVEGTYFSTWGAPEKTVTSNVVVGIATGAYGKTSNEESARQVESFTKINLDEVLNSQIQKVSPEPRQDSGSCSLIPSASLEFWGKLMGDDGPGNRPVFWIRCQLVAKESGSGWVQHYKVSGAGPFDAEKPEEVAQARTALETCVGDAYRLLSDDVSGKLNPFVSKVINQPSMYKGHVTKTYTHVSQPALPGRVILLDRSGLTQFAIDKVISVEDVK